MLTKTLATFNVFRYLAYWPPLPNVRLTFKLKLNWQDWVLLVCPNTSWSWYLSKGALSSQHGVYSHIWGLQYEVLRESNSRASDRQIPARAMTLFTKQKNWGLLTIHFHRATFLSDLGLKLVNLDYLNNSE